MERLDIMYDDPDLGVCFSMSTAEGDYPVYLGMARMDDGEMEEVYMSEEEAKMIHNWLTNVLYPVKENE